MKVWPGKPYKQAIWASLGLAAMYWVCHALISFSSSGMSLDSLAEPFFFLDSRWYSHIATNGYVDTGLASDAPNTTFAFFPLWPLLLRWFDAFFHNFLLIQFTGALLAQILFFATLLLVGCKKAEGPVGLVPNTSTGLALLCFSPGAWVFFTNHTEALFLLLSWASLYIAMRSQKNSAVVFSSVLAGLAALTRNQGILLSIATALVFFNQPNNSILRRVGSFVVSGAIAGGIYLLWPAYQWYLTGNPLISVEVQQHWQIVSSFGQYVSNLFWMSASNFGHRALFWLIVVTGGLLFRNPQSRPLSVYVILSALLWPLQGHNFPNAYRFGAILFPVWFFWGDKLHNLNRPKYLKFFILAGLVGWACMMSYAYFSRSPDVWPY